MVAKEQNTLTLQHQMEDAQVEVTFKKDKTPAPTAAPNATPQTGDNGMLSMWRRMLATATATLAGIGIYRRKKNRED